MTPLHKEALCWLILLAATAALYGVLALFIGPVAACGAFGLFGLAGLLPLVYRKRGQTVVMDERDTQIALRALAAGYSVFWLLFVLVTMGIWSVFYYQGYSTVSVQVLPNLVFGGMIVFMTARALGIIISYRLQDAGKGE